MENIVTNIIWHPASERPAHSGNYLAYITHAHNYITSLSYSKQYDLFNAHDDTDLEEAQSTAIDITAWAEIPAELEEFNDDDE